MQILFINQFFWPDTAATGQLLNDLTDRLSVDGAEVRVICGSSKYGGSAHLEQTGASQPQVDITRLHNSAFSRKVTGRMGSYLSFLWGALWHGMRGSAPSVVVTLTTPPLVSLVGMTIQKLRGARHVIWEMDVYPDVAVDLGLFKPNSAAARFFGWLADLPRRHADTVMVLGECMRARLLAHGIPAEKIVIAENWADSPAPAGPSDADPTPASPPLEGMTILYSGNFGLAHDVETIANVLVELSAQPEQPAGSRVPDFVFAGGGSRYAWLRTFARERKLANVTFLPYCERQELSARLASGHIGLVSQKTECLGSAVPSKTYGIMAAGRPILFIGPKESTPARIVERFNCGWQIDCGDTRGLVDLLARLSANPELVAAAGARAYQAFLAHYQRSIGVARIAGILNSPTEIKARAGAAWANPSAADS